MAVMEFLSPAWLLVILAALLLAAGLWDLRARIIPDHINAAIAVLAFAYLLLSGASWQQIAIQTGIALVILVVFALQFRFGLIGGGDVKMIAALALWVPAGAILNLLWIMALAGAAVGIATLVHHRLRGRPGRAELPYGIAIMVAGQSWIHQTIS